MELKPAHAALPTITLPTQRRISWRVPAWITTAWAALPSRIILSEADWQRRHNLVTGLLWAHLVILMIAFVALGYDLDHTITDTATLLLATIAASITRLDRRWRMLLASLGLMQASATIVHLTGGLIEAHFHFFIVVGVISLYGDWLPFLVALGYVLFHHGVVGTLDPAAVYNHVSAIDNPWKWAGIHAGAIVAASAVQLVHWRLVEQECQRRLAEARAREAAEEEARLRRELIAIAAHELRTPITTLGGYTEMLERRLRMGEEIDPRTERYLGQIQGQARRLTEMIASLMDVTRLESGTLDCTPQEGDLDRIVTTALDQVKPLARGRQIVFAPGDTALIGRWDSLRLEQVIINLVANAILYSPADTAICVTTECSDGRAVVRVIDQGAGITPENLERIFDQFYRARQRTEDGAVRRPDGLGLGLYIARTIVEHHGGELRAESAGLGHGSTFIVTLPLAAVPDAV